MINRLSVFNVQSISILYVSAFLINISSQNRREKASLRQAAKSARKALRIRCTSIPYPD